MRKKSTLLVISVLFSMGVGATAQEAPRARIYMGQAQSAPAWVNEAAKTTLSANQLAANEAWVKRVDAIAAEKRAKAPNTLKPEFGGPPEERVRGIVLSYDPISQTGMISGDDGRRWPFRGAEWRSQKIFKSEIVDFVPELETGFVLEVFRAPVSAATRNLEIGLTNRK